ncbi:hypothetical protein DSL72_005462 [Monilinia vaccinii-corymbosi]|uniref:Uncharacterized protein n=1 Tax=Monilinia vaccinii-corymbosi TaxID=61207 RepID=A0A8A3PFE7_9HELO|nr:hypothetical protein DSL72_005462 [Monilinia vaccinii-corymbosi]
MADNLPMSPFDNPQSLNYTIPMASRKTPQDQRPIIQSHDASTLEGQQLGAILAIKRAPRVATFPPLLAKVGDYVEVLAYYNANQVEVKSVRTGVIGLIEWEDLLPVPYDGKCGCLNGGCRCVYETWQAYSARRPLPAPQSSRQIPVYCKQDTKGMDVPVPTQMPVTPNSRLQLENIETKTNPEVNDPLTIAGQTPGAILVVKHFAHYPHDFGHILETEIGDHCVYLEAWEKGWGKVKVKNLRTGGKGFVRWEVFKPVNTRNRCPCDKGHCYCEYEDFEESRVYCEAQK